MPGKKESRYVYSPLHIKAVMEKIQKTGRPERLTGTYLRKTWLLSDKNYGSVLPILKDMGFLKDDGTPTDRYAKYQNQKFADNAVGQGIREAYPMLFAAYPDAHTLPKEELEGYFREHTGASPSVLEKIVSTFTTLTSLVDLSRTQEELPESDSMAPVSNKPKVVSHVSPSLQLNIQIHIDANASEQTIETVFKNMKKYLFDTEGDADQS